MMLQRENEGMNRKEYQRGYEAAYTEIYAAINSPKHPRSCGNCRACGVMRSVLEDAFSQLATMLTEEEFQLLAGAMQRLGSRTDAEDSR